MRDIFTEIWESIRRNKLRTALTGFAVSWGIFMLIVLLGAGNGLMNSFMRGSEGFATNSVEVGGGWTSMPYDGLKAGRRIRLDEGDITITAGELFDQNVDKVTATVSTSATVSLKDKSFSASIEGCFPTIQDMEKIEVRYGRFINQADIKGLRKVVVMPESAAENLLKRGTGTETLIGQYINVGNLAFKWWASPSRTA